MSQSALAIAIYATTMVGTACSKRPELPATSPATATNSEDREQPKRTYEDDPVLRIVDSALEEVKRRLDEDSTPREYSNPKGTDESLTRRLREYQRVADSEPQPIAIKSRATTHIPKFEP